ncbi:hypothetical protein BB560_001297 [Smittium megazygosporum]|uniref:30S ribosomal protein S17 n=1 Tax=Smittium megazygosporum TaxID=133381 RepID=A0A2T9ZHZ7_9FUNG|nr:hypothetical protein BB560_001297 [Smittium megazygosporum]
MRPSIFNLDRINHIGVVIGTAMQKTVKEIIRHKNYLAHDEFEKCKLGDIIRIEQCHKISRRKFFAVAEMIKRAEYYIDPDTGKELR